MEPGDCGLKIHSGLFIGFITVSRLFLNWLHVPKHASDESYNIKQLLIEAVINLFVDSHWNIQKFLFNNVQNAIITKFHGTGDYQ